MCLICIELDKSGEEVEAKLDEAEQAENRKTPTP